MAGKAVTRFVRPERLALLEEKIASYRGFRQLTAEWVDVAIDLERAERKTTPEA